MKQAESAPNGTLRFGRKPTGTGLGEWPRRRVGPPANRVRRHPPFLRRGALRGKAVFGEPEEYAGTVELGAPGSVFVLDHTRGAGGRS